MGGLMRLREKIMDPNPERRRGTRSHRYSLPKTNSREIQKLATRASIPHPQRARHLPIRHRQKRSHTTHRIPTSNGGHANLGRQPDICLYHGYNPHNTGCGWLPSGRSTLPTDDEDPPMLGPLIGALVPRQGTHLWTQPRRPPLLP